MLTGTVKWFDASQQRGYGFIVRNDGKADIFVHITEVKKAGLESLKANDVVTFDEQISNKSGKTSAINVKLITRTM